MTTPAIMLGLLAGPWLALLLIGRRPSRAAAALRVAGCVGIALVFTFTGIGHFVKTDAMVEMLPPFVPERKELIIATGFVELAAAIAVLVPRLRRWVGWGLIAMLVLFFPLNIYAAIMYVPMGGHASGPAYLLIRAPLQAILIGWVWWFAVRRTVREPGGSPPAPR